jgi:hypothetical protein
VAGDTGDPGHAGRAAVAVGDRDDLAGAVDAARVVEHRDTATVGRGADAQPRVGAADQAVVARPAGAVR